MQGLKKRKERDGIPAIEKNCTCNKQRPFHHGFSQPGISEPVPVNRIIKTADQSGWESRIEKIDEQQHRHNGFIFIITCLTGPANTLSEKGSPSGLGQGVYNGCC